MSDLKTAITPRYTIWKGGVTFTATAQQALRKIQREARNDSKVRKLTVQKYAKSLIADAAYFFPDGIVPHFLLHQDYPSDYDRALEYLAVMPSSGMRILSKR
jgi:hypothetical protein